MIKRYPSRLHWSAEDSLWIAEVYDLPGCMADGATQEDARMAAAEATALWLEVAREDGRSIPEPSSLNA